MQSFCRWAVVPEWCRCLFFYDAAVFLYSSIERNDTRNFREKKIFRVALSGTLEVKRVNHILYIICLYIIYSHIIYIYNIVFCSCSFSLMFYGINFLRPASGCFCIWYQKVVLQGVPGMIIRYHFIMPCLPINAATPKSTVSISFQTINKDREFYLPVFINRNLSF